MVERDRPTPYLSLSLRSYLIGEICFDTTHTHFGSIVHFGKPKRYYRNAFLLPSVGLNPSPLDGVRGEGFKRKRYQRLMVRYFL